MGYYAEGSGYFVLKKNADAEKAERIIADTFESTDIYTEKDGTKEISFYEGGKYYEDSVLECLNSINDYIEAGQVRYKGEDEAYWRFVFDPHENAWEEENGSIVYWNHITADQLPPYALEKILASLTDETKTALFEKYFQTETKTGM